MDIRGKKFVVIGGAGLIGSHAVDLLTRQDVGQIVIYDNFMRGTPENIADALTDPRVKVYDVGGDICQSDILNSALSGVDGVFHFAALWLLHWGIRGVASRLLRYAADWTMNSFAVVTLASVTSVASITSSWWPTIIAARTSDPGQNPSPRDRSTAVQAPAARVGKGACAGKLRRV